MKTESSVELNLHGMKTESRTELTLPFYPHMSHDDQDRVVTALADAVKRSPA